MAGFEKSCPHFRPSWQYMQIYRPYRPMFRLQEQFSECVTVFLIDLNILADHESSLSIYTGDSYGDRSYIDTSMTRTCSMQCRCRSLESDNFAFEVQKTASSISVRLCSFMLRMSLPFLFEPGSNPRCQTPDVIDGFHLLKSIVVLERRLGELRAEMQGSSPSHPYFRILIPSSEELAKLEAELSLLVEGLVADDQVFESFGYENLYEKGYLTYDRWKSFQSSKTSWSLDQLDRATNSIDQSEDEDLNKMANYDPAEVWRTSPQYDNEGPADDKSLSLIAAIYMGKNDVIAELLARGTNPMILSHIQQEDRWLVAKSLLDHGVNATSLFESTHGFESVEPRLLYVLMERGADIYSSWSTSTQGSLTQGLHVSGHEIQKVKSMRAHTFQLLSAIQKGDLRWVEEQISHGADPTFGIDSALVGGKWEILRLLLQKGADPRILGFGNIKVYLQGDVTADTYQLKVAGERYTKIVKCSLPLAAMDSIPFFILHHFGVVIPGDCLNAEIPGDCLNAIKIRCLYREFRRQHTHIVKCARASINLGWSPPRKGPHCPAWGDVFDYNHSKAWSRGKAVMRGLCRGEAPSALYDTIMFLAIGKAICLLNFAPSLSDHHAEFLADLGRWQVLFRSDEWSLSAFRNAISDIWQVSAEELDRVHPPDSTSLIHFQELAMSLIANVEQTFDRQGEFGKGLLASQERWSCNRVPEMSEPRSPEPFDMQFPDNIVERGKITESDTPDSTGSGETDVFPSPDTGVPLRDAIHNDSQTCNTIVVLLMAGFVFSVFLVFLKCKSLEPSLI